MREAKASVVGPSSSLSTIRVADGPKTLDVPPGQRSLTREQVFGITFGILAIALMIFAFGFFIVRKRLKPGASPIQQEDSLSRVESGQTEPLPVYAPVDPRTECGAERTSVPGDVPPPYVPTMSCDRE